MHCPVGSVFGWMTNDHPWNTVQPGWSPQSIIHWDWCMNTRMNWEFKTDVLFAGLSGWPNAAHPVNVAT